MGELVKIVLLLGGLGVVVLVLWLVAIKAGLLKAPPHPPAAADDTDTAQTPVPYRAAPSLLTPAEQAFYAALIKALPLLAASLGKTEPPHLLMKVRLADVLQVDTAKVKDAQAASDGKPSGGREGGKRGGNSWQSAQNRIDRKHADFVLTAPAAAGPRAFAPLLIIELDDATHTRPDRQSRDEFLDRACAAASLPILHMPVANTYDPAAVAEKIKGAISGEQAGSKPVT
jgi:hypothetical protein